MGCVSSFDVGGCGCVPSCLICAHVQTCAGVAVSGATVTITQGATTIGTGTTDASGDFCLDVIATGSGTYKVAASNTGYSGSNVDVAVTCNAGASVTLTISNTVGGWLPTFQGCNLAALPGALITVNGGSYTTNSSGQPSTGKIALPAGTWPYTVTKSRFNTASGNVTLGTCTTLVSGVTATLTPATGYQCIVSTTAGCATCVDPVPATLFITCPVGSLTLTYNPVSTFWEGCDYFSSGNVNNCAGGVHTANVPWGCVAKPNGTVQFYWTSDGATKYEGGTWTTCPTAFTKTCAGGQFIDHTPNNSCTSRTCPPGYTSSGSFSGLTGLAAIFNGTWTLSE